MRRKYTSDTGPRYEAEIRYLKQRNKELEEKYKEIVDELNKEINYRLDGEMDRYVQMSYT